MVVSEVLLNRFEELLLRATRELRPALALGDQTILLDDRCTAVAIPRYLVRPAEAVCIGPIHI
jgi:hypothetical protein